MKPHHIGYLVKSMEKSMKQFKALGYELCSDVVYDKYRDIDICFMKNNGYVVELIVPKSEASVVAKLRKKIGVSPYHICYITDDISRDIEQLRGQGYVPMGEPQIAPAIGGNMAAFMFNPNVGILEIVQTSEIF